MKKTIQNTTHLIIIFHYVRQIIFLQGEQGGFNTYRSPQLPVAIAHIAHRFGAFGASAPPALTSSNVKQIFCDLIGCRSLKQKSFGVPFWRTPSPTQKTSVSSGSCFLRGDPWSAQGEEGRECKGDSEIYNILCTYFLRDL